MDPPGSENKVHGRLGEAQVSRGIKDDPITDKQWSMISGIVS